MMRQRLIWLLVAVAAGMAGVALVHHYLQQREREVEQRYAAFRTALPVLVAARDIPEETVIDASMVEVRSIPEAFIQPYAISELNAVVGKVTVVPIAKGEQVLATKLEVPKSRQTLSAKLPPGKRAFTIGIDAISGVGGFLRPGDRVDMLGIFTLPSPQGAQALTVTLLQHVLLLAVGAEVIDQSATQARHKQESEGPRLVTLALSPQEAELVSFAREQGKLLLSLRPKGEKGLLELPPFSMNTLVSLLSPAAAQQAQQPQAPARKEIEVYRGLNREVVSVPR